MSNDKPWPSAQALAVTKAAIAFLVAVLVLGLALATVAFIVSAAVR